MSAKRFRLLPDVPTVNEFVPGFERPPAWMSYFGPARLSQPIVRRLNAEIVKAIEPPEVRARFEEIGFVVLGSTPEELADALKRDIDLARRITRAAGIRPE